MVAVGVSELRKYPRRQFGRAAWIDIGKGSALRLCRVFDISETGIGIRLATDDALPNSLPFYSAQQAAPEGFVALFSRMATTSAANLSADCLRRSSTDRYGCDEISIPSGRSQMASSSG